MFEHDAARLGPERTALLVAPSVGETLPSVGRPSESRRFMKMVHGHCCALSAKAPNQFLCAVYEDRPMLCRALEPGSGSCLEARAKLRLHLAPQRHAPAAPR